jgi:hypothetical protein
VISNSQDERMKGVSRFKKVLENPLPQSLRPKAFSNATFGKRKDWTLACLMTRSRETLCSRWHKVLAPTPETENDMKPFESITEPDERQKMFVGTLEDLHAELSAITLHAGVPEKVRDLFDTAITLSLYSWFVYDLHPIADMTGFLALEAALKARAAHDPALADKRLRALMRHALAAGWLSDNRLSRREEIARMRAEDRKVREAIRLASATGADQMSIEDPTDEEIAAEVHDMKIIESVCEAAVNLRNALAHGERMLAPGSYRRLRMTADLINQLFPVP